MCMTMDFTSEKSIHGNIQLIGLLVSFIMLTLYTYIEKHTSTGVNLLCCSIYGYLDGSNTNISHDS